MCIEHDQSRGISRRRLGTMLAGATGLALLPMAARAANVDTLCVTCIDYRFVSKDVTWLNTELKLAFNNLDLVALAGASLAGIITRIPQNPSALWDQISLAMSLHHINKVVLLDHMDCGAYKAAFGNPDQPPYNELAEHKRVMPIVAKAIRNSPYRLQAACYLMLLEGLPQEIPS